METKSKPREKRIAVVTGANKGIGLEIVKKLACNGVMVLLTARDEKRGNEAVENLIKSGLSDVLFHQLNVSDPASVASLAEFIKTKFGKLDILINNAGVAGHVAVPQDSDSCTAEEEEKSEDREAIKMHQRLSTLAETYEKAEECLNINYYGTKRATEVLIPLLRLSDLPRIVNLSSILGNLEYMPNKRTAEQLSDAYDLTEEGLDELLKGFLHDFKEGKVESNGWPIGLSGYKVSKMAINAYTRIIAKKFPTFCINSVHPGFVRTEMTGGIGTMSPEEGARGPVMLALLPKGGPSGLSFDKTEIFHV